MATAKNRTENIPKKWTSLGVVDVGAHWALKPLTQHNARTTLHKDFIFAKLNHTLLQMKTYIFPINHYNLFYYFCKEHFRVSYIVIALMEK
jgi:hypothetical protein